MLVAQWELQNKLRERDEKFACDKMELDEKFSTIKRQLAEEMEAYMATVVSSVHIF